MPTTVTRTIGTTGDYSTIQAWEDACPANLVTNDEIWRGECQNQEFVTSLELVISGQTADATRYVELTTVAGASFADHANKLTNGLRYNVSNGAAIRLTASYRQLMSISTNHTRVSKLQLHQSNGQAYAAIRTIGSSSVVISQVLARSAGGSPFECGSGSWLNCLAISDRATNGAGFSFQNGYVNSDIFNCTVVRPSNQTTGGEGFSLSYSNITVKNCAAFGYTNFFAGSGGASGNNNATNLSSVGFGTSNQVSLTYADQFEQPSNSGGVMDFRTKSGAALIDNGANLSSSGVTADIVGASRSAPYDIGAWEVTGLSPIVGTGAFTFDGMTIVGAGTLPIVGAGGFSFDGMTIAGIGRDPNALIVSAVGSSRTRRGARRVYLQDPPPSAVFHPNALPAELAGNAVPAWYDEDEEAWMMLG